MSDAETWDFIRGDGIMRRDQNRGPKRKEGGFTLIEVMVAIALLSFGILAVATMQTSAMRANYNGYRLTEATTLAQDRIEYLTTQSFDDLVEGDDQADPDPVDSRGDHGVASHREGSASRAKRERDQVYQDPIARGVT
jgi:prepilin-type N-terminal cleavage/methylation domain-containing protein